MKSRIANNPPGLPSFFERWTRLLMLALGALLASAPLTASAQTLPTHLLMGYWQNWSPGAIRIINVPTTYDIIAVSFAIQDSTPGEASFALDSGLSSELGGYTQADFIADIAAVKARGQHVIISCGGASGNIVVNSSASATNFANSVNALMSQYGFEGVDVDFESGINVTYLTQALRAVKSGSIITMAPQTTDVETTSSPYFALALNIKDILTICNTQYYNSGTMYGYDGKIYTDGTVDFITALATILLQDGLRPDQVGLGVPASTAAGSGYVSPSVVNEAVGILATGASGGTYRPPQVYPTLRGVMTWSINIDAAQNYSLANTVSPYLRSLDGGGGTTVATPTFSPGGGTYTSAQNVTISDSTGGASIRYTTDGSTPTSTTGTIYSGPVNISSTAALKAMAYESGDTDSSVTSASYTIGTGGGGCVTATAGGSWQNTAMSSQTGTFTATFDATPSASPTNAVIALSNGAQTAYANFACLARFNPSGDIDARNGGAYAAASTIPYSAGVSYHFRLVVNVSAQTYSIYVTPAGGSELTVGLNYAFRISDTTLNYWGVFVDSGSGGSGTVAACNFSNGGGSGGTVATPTFSPVGGTYTSAQSVSLSDSTGGATIYYTTNGTAPTTSSTVYSGPIPVNSGTVTIEAIGAESGFTNSNVTSSTYTISPVQQQVATPTFSPGSGTYTSAQSVSLSDSTGGATIYYTTNGTTPTTSSTVYSGPIPVNSGTVTIEAIGAASGFTNSNVTSSTYTIATPTVATPSFSPGGGTYTSTQYATISDATSGASIYYTTNGTAPSTSSAVYSGPIAVSSGTVTIEAMGAASGMTTSSVASATYTISTGGGGCFTATAGGSWQNATMASQTGTFTATFDATPSASPTNSVIALSNGAQTTYANFACLARFNPTGDIDAYNGTAYAAAGTIPYSAGVSYHFRLVVNIAAQTYSVYVTPAGGSELTVGLNYAFRMADTTLNYWGVYVSSTSGGTGTDTVCNFSTGGSLSQAAAPSFSPAPGSYTGAQSVSITTSTSGASIRYTTDGSTPTETAGTIYSGPVNISSSATLKAIAYAGGYTDSNVTSGAYTITTTSGEGPFGGNPAAIPGTVQAENYDTGGQGLAYNVTSINGTDNGYRSDGVDLEATTDTGGGVDLGWTTGSQWFKYTVNVATAGTYTVSFRVAAPSAVTDAFHLANSSGTNLSGSVSLPATGGYQTWTTVTANVTLSAGQQILTLDQDNAGWNINYMGFATGGSGSPPNFGPNVIIFDPSMSSSSIQNQINNIYSQQQSASSGQFDSARYALLFKPGTYNNTVDVGYYTQVLGLGQSPDDVTINGGVVSNSALSGNNSTCNFWEGAENLAVVPAGGTDQWAVSQACPMRRMHLKGSIVLTQNGGWGSGGFLSDSLIDNQINSSSQQQWISRNCQWGSWAGGSWNMVFVGDSTTPAANFPANTVVTTTPVVREKPFLTIDSGGNYSVFVPALRSNSQGTTWSNGTEAGQSIPISQFYIAHAGTDTAATINAALNQGLNLLLTPGIYSLNGTIQVTQANTVVLGLGLATLLANNGATAMTVADVDGVTISGILFDAGSTNSPFQLQVGPTGSNASHATNPTVLHDLFFRVGGAAVGKTTVSLQINSNNVIGDDFWIWRADHGNSGTVGWTTNTATNGLVVNGANVTIYGLAVEHYQQYQTLWNGNGGSVYFYQSEAPYDPPNQSSWMAGSEDGYASYKVANTVTSHQAYGVGVYCNFDVNPAVILGNAIEVPTAGLNGAMLHDMVTVSLGGTGTIAHIIDGYGNAANSSNNVSDLVK